MWSLPARPSISSPFLLIIPGPTAQEARPLFWIFSYCSIPPLESTWLPKPNSFTFPPPTDHPTCSLKTSDKGLNYTRPATWTGSIDPLTALVEQRQSFWTHASADSGCSVYSNQLYSKELSILQILFSAAPAHGTPLSVSVAASCDSTLLPLSANLDDRLLHQPRLEHDCCTRLDASRLSRWFQRHGFGGPFRSPQGNWRWKLWQCCIG